MMYNTTNQKFITLCSCGNNIRCYVIHD